MRGKAPHRLRFPLFVVARRPCGSPGAPDRGRLRAAFGRKPPVIFRKPGTFGKKAGTFHKLSPAVLVRLAHLC